MFLREIKKRDCLESKDYPYCTDVVKQFESLKFEAPVTMLCGDNGSGKSTLIELIAEKCAANRISDVNEQKIKLEQIKRLARDFTAVMDEKPRRKILFTAEAFTRYVDFLYEERRDAERELKETRERYGDTYAGKLASMPYCRTVDEIDNMYARSLETQSHGQGFIDFFGSRISSAGLFLLDEPEAALAYDNQLALIYMMQAAVKKGAQFIVSTHSPIILAYPNAKIYEIIQGELTERTYDRIGSIAFLRRFFDRHSEILREE